MAVFPKEPSEGGGCTIDHTREQQVSEDTRGVSALLLLPWHCQVTQIRWCYKSLPVSCANTGGNGKQTEHSEYRGPWGSRPTGLYRTYEHGVVTVDLKNPSGEPSQAPRRFR